MEVMQATSLICDCTNSQVIITCFCYLITIDIGNIYTICHCSISMLSSSPNFAMLPFVNTFWNSAKQGDNDIELGIENKV